MFGLSCEQALGRPVAEVIVPTQHRQAHEAGMRRVTEGGAPRLLGQRVETGCASVRLPSAAAASCAPS